MVIVEVTDPVNNIFKIDFKYIYTRGSQISPSDPTCKKLNGEWKFTSNSKISDVSDIYPLTRIYKDTDGVYKMFSGINFEIWDHNNQFNNVLITGTGLPTNGILLEKSAENLKQLVLVDSSQNSDLPMDHKTFYTMDDDAIAKLKIDDEFIISVRNSSNVTIETRVLKLNNKPIYLDNWNSEYFPKIDGLQSHSLLEAKIGSRLNF